MTQGSQNEEKAYWGVYTKDHFFIPSIPTFQHFIIPYDLQKTMAEKEK